MKTETGPSHMKTETSPSHTKTSLTEHQVHVREKMLTRSNTGIREPDLTTINRDQLERLANYSGDLCLSIYMPVAGPQRELQQGNAILLRNLIREADTQLREPPYELRARERRALLRLARRISRWNGNFWAYQQEGLAFFLAPDFQQIVTLPVAPPAQVVLAPHFYVKPLLACPLGDHHFYVLALSLKQSRLYHATCAGIEEIPLPDVPTSLQEAVPSDRFEKQLQFRGGASSPGGRGRGRQPVFYYSNYNPSTQRKEQALRFCRELDRGLKPYLRGDTAPLVVIGADYLVALYRQANSYPYLAGTVSSNPDVMAPRELRAAAWEVVEPQFRAPREQALEALPVYLRESRASTQLPEILRAAYDGRVEVLLVADDYELWGYFEPPFGPMDIAGPDTPGMGRQPLLNLAILYTLRGNGAVYTLPAAQVPGPDGIAALFYQ